MKGKVIRGEIEISKPKVEKTGKKRNTTKEVDVWEVRKEKFISVLQYLGAKLEALFWVVGAILVTYYTNFMKVMFNHRRVNK